MKAVKTWIKKLGRQYLAGSASKRTGLSPEHWGLAYEANALNYQGTPLREVLDNWGSPLHVILPEKLFGNLADFQSPGLEVFYSYKTNPLPWVFDQLHRRGAGAEVISAYELWLALKLGVAPQHIIYNGPAKSEASIRTAIECGIASINANNIEELATISALALSMGKVANIGIRVTSTQGWTGQFGFPAEDGSALNAFRHALKLPAINVVTLHCHRGALIRDLATLDRHLNFMLSFAQELHGATGWWPKILDVGGSLGIPSTRYLSARESQFATTFLVPPAAPEPATCLLPRVYAEKVVQTVTERCALLSLPLPRIVTEVGRSLTGNAQMLLTTVQNWRRGDDFDYAVMDAGVSVASIVTSEYHELLALQRKPGPKRCHRIVGPICHMGDTLFLAHHQPSLQQGDALAIMDSGAYFIADAASFSFAQPAVVALYADGHQTLVRKAESFEHLISLDHLDPPGKPVA
ncbi:MAG: hypothetical protein KAY82_03475 [Hylemonella sp.]|nr:hypothetical protein [Hylemonella sp.]